MHELSPERQAIADDARKRAVLPGIEAVKALFIPGESDDEEIS